MARNGSGVYSLPAGSTIANGETSDQTDINTPLSDLEADANAARPIVAGGTGATSASGARTNLGLGTAATKDTGTGSGEVPVLDGDGLLDRALLPGAGVSDKAADYTAVSDDAGTLLKFTGAHTLTLPTASTLPDGWSVIVVADGGDVTIASDSFINGSSGDYTVPQGLFVHIFNRGFSYDVLGVSELTPTQAEDDTETTPGLVSGSTLAGASPVKAWVNFDGTGTVSIRESFNVSSITDDGTGTFTINFQNNLADANYAAVATTTKNATSGSDIRGANANAVRELTVSSCRLYTLAVTNVTSLQDPELASVLVAR